MTRLVVDASVIIAALLPDEPYNQAARAVLQSSLPSECMTSSLMRHEVVNALWQAVRARRLKRESALLVLQEFENLQFLVRDAPCVEILKLTEALNRPATYDTSYLALAQAEKIPLITADKRLYNALKRRFKWLRWVENP